MKSNVKNREEKKIILSIGMIVKNEEKHLENCLSALQKLRDKVPSELIIVDTGSTDRTKEIALKYTDKVYDFEWINDFAAARNCGLEKAVGEWFMYIDADEYLDENCEEMIKFFNMPEVRGQYNSASYIIKNYTGAEKKVSGQFMAPRVVRLMEGIKFHDSIHEWLPRPEPQGYFGTVFHHFGYSYESEAEKSKKSDRNLIPLLEEYKKLKDGSDPLGELRVISHICDAIYDDKYFQTPEIKEKYLDEFVNKSRKHIDEFGINANIYAIGSFISYARYNLYYGQYSKAIDLLKEFIALECAKDSLLSIMAYLYLSRGYMALEKYPEAFEAQKKYFEFYNKYKNNEISVVPLNYASVQGLSEYEYDEVAMYATRCLNNLERYDEAIEYLAMLSIDGMDLNYYKMYLNVLRDLVEKTHKYSYAISCYEKTVELNDDKKTELILYLLEQYYMEHPAEKEDYIKEVLKSGKKGKYIDLVRIIKDDLDGKDIKAKLSNFITSHNNWGDGYCEAIYLAMKHGVDINPAIEKMSHDVLKDIITTISNGHSVEYPAIALDYCINFDYSSGIRQMFWCVTALEAAIPKSNEIKKDRQPELFDLFVSILSDYVSNIYNPDLLNPEDAEVLPALHRFGYYIILAFNAKNEGDTINYIRNMKEGLRLCENMKNVISFYINELKEEMK